MRSGRPGGGRHVPGRAARARAEQLWRETVARTPEPESATNGLNAPHLPLSPSQPDHIPQSPGARSASLASRHPARRAVARSGPAAREGGEGNAGGSAESPSPPLGEERAGVRRGKVRSSDSSPSHNGATSEPPLPSGPATRKLRALWISAFHLGLARDRSDAALVDWLHRQKTLDAKVCLSADGLAGAIQLLEAWLARAAGVDWRPHLSLGRNGRVREIRRPRARVLEAQWRLLYRQGRVRIGSHAALGAYAARFADLGRADSHLALSDDQTDALIRHLGKCIRAADTGHG